jgi:hypothetical protein
VTHDHVLHAPVLAGREPRDDGSSSHGDDGIVRAMDYTAWAKALQRSIQYNPELAMKLTVGKKPATRGVETLPPALRAYYSQANGFDMTWSNDQPGPRGRIRILPLDDVLRDGKGLVWFDHSPPHMRDFKLVDFFADEAAVGFFEGRDELHLYEFAGAPTPLGIDFTRYAELLSQTRGYFYWQLALIPSRRKGVEVSELAEALPQLFPDFDPTSLGLGASAKTATSTASKKKATAKKAVAKKAGAKKAVAKKGAKKAVAKKASR